MVYVLKIKKEKVFGTLKELEKYLKTTFKSNDYMYGFLDGYLFGNYSILTLEKFEKELIKNLVPFNDNYYIKFIKVFNEDIYK